jgi:hypothetical protein
VSYVSDELVLQGADVRPRRFFTVNGATGPLDSITVEPYTLMVLTSIDIAQIGTAGGYEVTFVLQPSTAMFWVFTTSSAKMTYWSWRGWLPMQSGDYIEMSFGEECSGIASGYTYPNNI